jgi:pimeloyl-ACP methyl ester carboxylesterase
MSFFTTSDGHKLYFSDTVESSGEGQPLLCLAGLTRCSRDFSFLKPHVTQYRMITMDYRGRGESDHDPDFMNYNILREAKDVLELLDHLGVEKVTVLGSSRGGLVAMALAAQHPERMSGAILNDIGPVVGASGIARIMDYVGKQPVSRTLDEAAQVLKSVMEPQFPGVPLKRWREQAAIQYHQAEDGLKMRYDPALRKALLDQAATGAMPPVELFFRALSNFPLGVIRGENSDILPHDTLEKMIKDHPGMLWAEVPDRGHPPFLDEPDSLRIIHAIMDQTA